MVSLKRWFLNCLYDRNCRHSGSWMSWILGLEVCVQIIILFSHGELVGQWGKCPGVSVRDPSSPKSWSTGSARLGLESLFKSFSTFVSSRCPVPGLGEAGEEPSAHTHGCPPLGRLSPACGQRPGWRRPRPGTDTRTTALREFPAGKGSGVVTELSARSQKHQNLTFIAVLCSLKWENWPFSCQVSELLKLAEAHPAVT